MNAPQKPGKRIVSRSEYIQALIERAVANVTGSGLVIIACVFALAVVYCTCFYIYNVCRSHPYTPLQVRSFWQMLCVSPFALYFVVKVGQNNLRYASSLDVGVPLTHANTGDLPAPDSLVRASAEPTQEQQTTLLRAAAGQETETASEELVRAVEGIQRGLEQMRRGEGRPAEEVFAEFRARHGIAEE